MGYFANLEVSHLGGAIISGANEALETSIEARVHVAGFKSIGSVECIFILERALVALQ